jgi:hypothetical protein
MCCAHCAFNPLGCRCKYGEFEVPQSEEALAAVSASLDPEDDRVCHGCDEVIEDCFCEQEDEPEPLMLSCDTEDCIFQGPHFASECVTAEQMAAYEEENQKEHLDAP